MLDALKEQMDFQQLVRVLLNLLIIIGYILTTLAWPVVAAAAGRD
jgi:hypothetical protein